jgi:hypothetical protein
VLRDLSRLGSLELAVERAGAAEELSARLRRSVDEPAFGALHFRRQLTELIRSVQVRRLDGASAELIRRRQLTPGWSPETDADYPELLEGVLAVD